MNSTYKPKALKWHFIEENIQWVDMHIDSLPYCQTIGKIIIVGWHFVYQYLLLKQEYLMTTSDVTAG